MNQIMLSVFCILSIVSSDQFLKNGQQQWRQISKSGQPFYGISSCVLVYTSNGGKEACNHIQCQTRQLSVCLYFVNCMCLDLGVAPQVNVRLQGLSEARIQEQSLLWLPQISLNWSVVGQGIVSPSSCSPGEVSGSQVGQHLQQPAA